MADGARTEFTAVTDYLFGLKPPAGTLGLDRIRPLAAELGHPERLVPCIHVAGTNGKGSVSAMLDAILRAAGWRVGLFTSPHLRHVGERVQVNRQPLTEEEIVALMRELRPLADKIAQHRGGELRPTFFELMAAMGFLQFARKQCDIAVIEVGLGGEFDATNIVTPEVSVITSIGLDHCEWLGDTIEKIARAKAGIIKRERPIVIGRLPPEAEHVIRAISAQRVAPLRSVREEFGDEVTRYPRSSLEGLYQRANAATATLAARTLPAAWRISAETIAAGLFSTHWPGRWERLNVGGRRLVLDASHNPEGAEALDDNLAQLTAESGAAPIVVTGVLGEERAAPLLATICRHAKAVHLVIPQQPRATSHEALERLVPMGFRGAVVRDSIARIFPGGRTCAIGRPDDTVVVTGSLYLLGEVLTQLDRE